MSIHTEYTSYSVESTIFKGYLAWDETTNEKRPGVLVFPEWWGMNEYIQKRTKQIAELGFVAMGVDMYGEGKTVDNPDEAGSLMNTVISDKKIVKDRVQAAYNVLKGHTLSDSRRLGAIGYCFGGMAALECVRGGLNVAGVVSFHGLLQTGEDPNPAVYGAIRPELKTHPNDYNTQAVVLVENGADDHLVSDTSKQRFFEEMNRAGVDWNFHHHARTPHGFALPPSLGPPGKLYEAADRRSTMNMLSLFREIFPKVSQNPVPFNACGTPIPV